MNKPAPSAFILLETMIGVAIFAIGVIALAQCVNNCLNAEMIKAMDQRARLVLDNRMSEIQERAVQVEEKETSEKLEGMFKGITLKQSRTLLELKNEKEEPLEGLFNIKIEAFWKAPGGEQSKSLYFYDYQVQ